jgi:LysM repeat protein
MPPPPPVTPPPETAAGTTYEVVQHDTLAKIAKAQGVTLKALEAANPGVDPKKLKIKQKLNIPAKSAEASPTAATATENAAGASGEKTYTVKSGDTLSKIAKKNDVKLPALRAANPKYASTDHIRVGEKLNIPAKTETAPPTAAAETPAPPVVTTPPPPYTPSPSNPPPGTPPPPAPGH